MPYAESMAPRRLLTQIRLVLLFFAVALIASGLTAIVPLQGLRMLAPIFASGSAAARLWPALAGWLNLVHHALEDTYASYPFLAYGYDWLAFGHFIIAVPFLMAVRDPLRSTWVIPFGIAACLLVLPHALIFGAVRGIPVFWRLVDALFGIGGLITLLLLRQRVRLLSVVEGSPSGRG